MASVPTTTRAGMLQRTAANPDIILRFPPQKLDGRELATYAIDFVRRLTVVWYIGISEQPELRFETHSRNGYETMFIIAVCPSSRETANVEMAVLAQCRFSRLCSNATSGGEHASAGSPHFVYVCTRGSSLIRRSGLRSRRFVASVADDLLMFARGF